MSFDTVARAYRWIEYAAFGTALEGCRFRHLDRLKHAQQILILGEGDGRCLERLLSIAPQASFTVIDSSAEMIALAKQRIVHVPGSSERVLFQHLDARRLTHWPSGEYDAVITQFFLDCFTEQDARALVNRIAKALRPNGLWLVSEFYVPSSGSWWRRAHSQLWLWSMYTFFGLTAKLDTRALPPVDRLLEEAGIRLLERKESRFGLMASSVRIRRT